MCDLIESYFFGLKQRNEEYYRSWTHTKQPQRHVMEQIMKGVCSDLTRKADEVSSYFYQFQASGVLLKRTLIKKKVYL